MNQHGSDGKAFFLCSFEHVLIAPLYTGVIHRAKNERKNTAYVNRRKRTVYIFKADRNTVFGDPVVEYDQQAPANQYQKCGFCIWTFSEFPEHSFLRLVPAVLSYNFTTNYPCSAGIITYAVLFLLPQLTQAPLEFIYRSTTLPLTAPPVSHAKA